jgi:hypothetical protein
MPTGATGQPAAFTDAIDTLGVAFHEVGHGLAGHLGGMPVRRLRIERSWWTGNVTCGYTLLDPPAPNAEPAAWKAYAVMLFAGQAAQLRYLDNAGVLTRALHDRVENGARGDYEYWLADKACIGLTETAARRAAAAFCDAHWPRMTRLAELLARTERMAGSAL